MTTNRFDEIDELLAAHKDELKAADDHEQLKDFAKEHDLFSKADFGKYKHCLKKLGIDYNRLRDETFAARDAERAAELDDLPANAPLVRLWAAASENDDGTSAAYAICDDQEDAVWYGQFFDDDRLRTPGDPISAEQSVADKAVWVAGKALAAAGHTAGRVEIFTTCPDLDTDALQATGARHGVAVSIVVDDDERAVVMSEVPGYKRWQDTDLATLVTVDEEGEDD